jgi:hypothetical protein
VTRLTREQSAVIGAYTGILCGPFVDMHEYIERIMGGPIFTHQMPSLREKIREASKPDFLLLCCDDDETDAPLTIAT